MGLTNQEKIQYLSRHKNLDRRIERKCEELSRWRERATKITPTLSDTPKSPSSGADSIQTAVEHIIELESEINADIDQLTDTRREISEAIQTVKDEKLQLLLEYRYVDGMTWDQIAVKMEYSYMHICRLHGKALSNLKM